MWRCCIRLYTGFMIMSHCTGVNREQPTEKRCGPRARPGPETSKSLWFGHDQEIVCGASAVCTCIFNLCWPAGRGMRCLPGWLCCGKGVVASAPLAPQAGPPFRLFARMSSFPAAHTAGDYRHCRVNLSSGLAKSTLSRSLCYNTTDRNDHTPRAPSSPPTYIQPLPPARETGSVRKESRQPAHNFNRRHTTIRVCVAVARPEGTLDSHLILPARVRRSQACFNGAQGSNKDPGGACNARRMTGNDMYVHLCAAHGRRTTSCVIQVLCTDVHTQTDVCSSTHSCTLKYRH